MKKILIIEESPLFRDYLGRKLAAGLTRVKDPLSGFFACRRDVISGMPLTGQGFKILLEILAQGMYSRVIEYPISFCERRTGRSKIGVWVCVCFLLQGIRLYLRAFMRFLVYGRARRACRVYTREMDGRAGRYGSPSSARARWTTRCTSWPP